MTPLEKEVILKQVSTILLADYARDLFKKKGTERLLQELIEAAIDMNTHILVKGGCGAPEDHFDSFIRMGAAGVLSEELARSLAPSAGLRNRIVHEYDTLNDEQILDSVKNVEALLPRYLKSIRDFLASH